MPLSVSSDFLFNKIRNRIVHFPFLRKPKRIQEIGDARIVISQAKRPVFTWSIIVCICIGIVESWQLLLLKMGEYDVRSCLNGCDKLYLYS